MEPWGSGKSISTSQPLRRNLWQAAQSGVARRRRQPSRPGRGNEAMRADLSRGPGATLVPDSVLRILVGLSPRQLRWRSRPSAVTSAYRTTDQFRTHLGHRLGSAWDNGGENGEASVRNGARTVLELVEFLLGEAGSHPADEGESAIVRDSAQQ